MHELMRTIALEAWQHPQPGKAMGKLLEDNGELKTYIPPQRLEELLDVRAHLGDAPDRANQLVKLINTELAA